ncbi:hypothetical protein IMZ48_46490 [Candidatus Bathyarchaeota archaeon]|nr:hypothetical protein [Candidatus Bathyarchaeota archaeon]
MYSGAGDDPDDNKPPNWNGSPVFDGDFVGCLLKRKLKCWDSAYLANFDPGLLIDLDTGLPFEKRSVEAHGELEPRGIGKGREFTVQTPSGTSFVITSHKVSKSWSAGGVFDLLLTFLAPVLQRRERRCPAGS